LKRGATLHARSATLSSELDCQDRNAGIFGGGLFRRRAGVNVRNQASFNFFLGLAARFV
jgi:hypothetical protein